MMQTMFAAVALTLVSIIGGICEDYLIRILTNAICNPIKQILMAFILYTIISK